MSKACFNRKSPKKISLDKIGHNGKSPCQTHHHSRERIVDVCTQPTINMSQTINNSKWYFFGKNAKTLRLWWVKIIKFWIDLLSSYSFHFVSFLDKIHDSIDYSNHWSKPLNQEYMQQDLKHVSRADTISKLWPVHSIVFFTKFTKNTILWANATYCYIPRNDMLWESVLPFLKDSFNTCNNVSHMSYLIVI